MSISFDRSSKCYKAGEVMNGQVEMTSGLFKSGVQDLYLRISGVAEVKFLDNETKLEFINKSVVVDESILIFSLNSHNNDQPNSDPAVQHIQSINCPSIIFQYRLGGNLPASSTGSQARISYYAQLTASYKTEDRDSELGSREVFSVLAELDLNLLPEVFKDPYPILFRFTNKRRNPAFPLALLLERRCFTPGEVIRILEGRLAKVILKYAQVIKEVTCSGHHKGTSKQMTQEEQVIREVHNLVSYSGQALLTLPKDLTPTSKCPCCTLVYTSYRLEVAIECDKSIYETKLGIVIGTLQLKQTTSSGCSSLVPFLEKASKLGRKSSDVSINSIPSFPTHLSPIEEMEDRPERNDYFVSDKANSIARMAVDHSRSTYLTTSFKTLVLLAIAASFVMPLTGIPAILLAILSKKSKSGKGAYYFLRISYGFALSSFLVFFVVAAALPGLLIGFFG